MSTLLELLQLIKKMGHNEVDNYVLPGLTSSLVGGFGYGRVRLFSASRETREWVIPHSHRFDFGCLVLHGEVENILFEPGRGQAYGRATIRHNQGDRFGMYTVERHADETVHYTETATKYGVGQAYCMTAKQIHSIRFSETARVLFFEGPEITNESVVLEPWCNGGIVPTFETASWMFQRRHGGSDTTSTEGDR